MNLYSIVSPITVVMECLVSSFQRNEHVHNLRYELGAMLSIALYNNSIAMRDAVYYK
jgi:hypothetical protein